jgi:LysR family transcriptional regulator for metE and metH
MVPTAAGERLAKSAHEILEALASAERAIHMFAGGERGRLRVGVAGCVSYRWLPSVLTQYRSMHANIDVQFPELSATGAIADLLAGSIDVGIGPGSIDDKRLHVEPLVHDEIVFAVAPGHRLAARAFAEPGDLGDEPLFVDASERSSGVYRQIVDAAGRLPGNLVMPETAATLEFVQAGTGVAIVGRWVIEPLIRAGVLHAVRITRKGVSCGWSASMLKHLAESVHVRDLVALVAREIRQRRRS